MQENILMTSIFVPALYKTNIMANTPCSDNMYYQSRIAKTTKWFKNIIFFKRNLGVLQCFSICFDRDTIVTEKCTR